jgi:DNA-binding SARP family transcriptional activator
LSTLQLRLLGPARLTRDGELVSLANAKGLALLGFLAANHDPVTREVVLGLLWPDSSQDAARKNLRNTLWAVGNALGKDAVLAQGDRLALSSEAWVDLHALEAAAPEGQDAWAAPVDALVALADLYRGPLLEGLVLHDAPEFELWLTSARDVYATRYIAALGALVEALKWTGDWPAVASAARRALAVDPLHEPMHQALIEALARSGQRAEALRAYEHLRQTLSDELDVAPLAETEALVAELQGGRLGPLSADGAAPGERTLDTSRRTVAVPFLGRERELAALDRAVATARRADGSGAARAVILSGEAGIGKSRLWQVWSEALPAGTIAVATRALEGNRALPFVPIAELLSRAAPFQRLLRAGSPLAPLWLAEVARLLPELRLRMPDLPPSAELPPEEERRRLFEALTQTLLAVGGRPLVLFVDDVQWADDTTLGWLGYLLHRLRDDPFVLVLALRTGDLPATCRAIMTGWERDGIAERLVLGELDDGAAAALLDALGADPAAAARYQAQARGNPLFLAELARAGGEEIPPVLAEAIRARLARLPETELHLLQAVAVLEPDADFEALRRTAVSDEEATLDALDALLAAAILAEQDGRYSFAHPLIGEVLRDSLSAARRSVLHRRAAEVLEDRHADDLAVVAGSLAAHYVAAGQPKRAADNAALAAERALAMAAPGEAVVLYQQALALDPSPARQLALGAALVRRGDVGPARDAFQAALDGFVAAGDRRQAAEACFGLSGSYLGTGQAGLVVDWAERGLGYLDGAEDPATLALAQFLLGAGGQDHGPSQADAETHLRAAAELAREHNLPHLLGQSQFELGNLRARQGDLVAARAAYRDTIGLARAAGDSLLETLGHNNAAYHALLAEDLPDAQSHLASGLALAERADLAPARQWLFSTAGELALAEARWDDAEGWFRRALREAEQYGNLEQVANTRANLAQVERGRGRLREAALLLAAAAHTAARLESPYLQTEIDLRRAEVELARGEGAAATGALAQADARLAEWPQPAQLARAAALRAALV